MIRELYDQATPEDIKRGMAWYDDAHRWAVGVSEKYEMPLENVVAVTAALSPANKWERNRHEAEAMIQVYSRGGDPDTVSSCTYSRNKARAIEALERGLEVLSGDKTVSFAANILEPEDESVVTIDRHAYNATLGERLVKTNRGPKVTSKRYREAAQTFIDVAGHLGIRPNQLQAIIWLTWRRELGIT